MTSRRTLNMLFTIHSWAGIVTGLLMFIVCFSGAVVVFKNEIDLWANPSLAALPRASEPTSLDAIVRNVQERYPGTRVDTIVLPDEVTPGHFVFVREQGGGAEGQRTKLAVRSDTAEVVGPVDSQLGQFLRALHVFLFFGPRWIVGFLGVAMLVMIGTGFVIHRKIIAELFTQRWGRSFRLVMSDLHKAAGIWGLAFHLLIAFTGAWLGLAPVFERAFGYLAQPTPEVSKRAPAPAAAMITLDEARAAALRAVPDFEPRQVTLRQWGRADAQVSFAGNLADHLASTARVQVAGASGQVQNALDPRARGFWSQFNGLMEPLHFGNFGGLALKWLYFALGMAPAFLSLSGTLIWLDGRRQRHAGGARRGVPG